MYFVTADIPNTHSVPKILCHKVSRSAASAVSAHIGKSTARISFFSSKTSDFLSLDKQKKPSASYPCTDKADDSHPVSPNPSVAVLPRKVIKSSFANRVSRRIGVSFCPTAPPRNAANEYILTWKWYCEGSLILRWKRIEYRQLPETPKLIINCGRTRGGVFSREGHGVVSA
ncbi:hypothetical protein CEXT_722981 [Caerostris extrusa]|uniref:Uncharacterized protein n=1 Tax=Caerostris extrusa TaxID=172846 RepID=A0AAV4VEE3_CAEEX|nr:hypothetical protein CEXT_722981 [Caerostris extrusa]